MNLDDLFLLVALLGLAITILITDKSLSKQTEEVQPFSKGESIQHRKRKLIYHKIPGKRKIPETSSKNKKRMPKS
jgi:hypothetical protein